MTKGLRSYHCSYISVLSSQYILVTYLIATILRIGVTSRGRAILSDFQGHMVKGQGQTSV